MEPVFWFWVGIASISGAIGNLYGAPYGWLTFGAIISPIALISVLATKEKT